MEKLVIDMKEFNLVVEKYDEVELVVYMQDKVTDCITQDVVTVRGTSCDKEPLSGAVECLVWADGNNEDYTHKFTINRYLGE